jgi:hypothetical protein
LTGYWKSHIYLREKNIFMGTLSSSLKQTDRAALIAAFERILSSDAGLMDTVVNGGSRVAAKDLYASVEDSSRRLEELRLLARILRHESN